MTKKDYELIASSIWRSGMALSIKDKNMVKRQAREEMRRLIVNDLVGSLKNKDSKFKAEKFIELCGL